MRTLGLISFCVCLIFGTSAVAETPEAKKPKLPKAEAVVEYVNSFDTLSDLLNELSALQVITDDDTASVLSLLQKDGISTNEKLVPGVIDGNKIKWGKTSLTVGPKEVLKTSDGLVIKAGSFKSFEAAFAEVFAGVSNKPKSALSEFFVPNANAQEKSVGERVSAAAYAGAYHAVKASYTALIAAGSATVNLVAFPLERTSVGIRNLLYKGKVECLYGEYVVNSGFNSFNWRKDFLYWKKLAKQESVENADNFESTFSTYSSDLYGSMLAGAHLLENAFKPSKDSTAVSRSFLLSVFGKEVPVCTTARAAKVQAALKSKARIVDTKIKAAASKRPAGNGPVSPASSVK